MYIFASFIKMCFVGYSKCKVLRLIAGVATYFGLSGIRFLVDWHASPLSRVEVSAEPLQDVAMKRYKSEVERERQ